MNSKILSVFEIKFVTFQTQVKSTPFVDHFCRNVFPVFDLIEGEEAKAQIVKLLAELCLYTGDLADAKTAAKNVHEKLLVSWLLKSSNISNNSFTCIILNIFSNCWRVCNWHPLNFWKVRGGFDHDSFLWVNERR